MYTEERLLLNGKQESVRTENPEGRAPSRTPEQQSLPGQPSLLGSWQHSGPQAQRSHRRFAPTRPKRGRGQPALARRTCTAPARHRPERGQPPLARRTRRTGTTPPLPLGTCGRGAPRGRAPASSARPAVPGEAPPPPPVVSAAGPAAAAAAAAAAARPGPGPAPAPPARTVASGSGGPAPSAHHRASSGCGPRPSCARPAALRSPLPPPPAMFRPCGPCGPAPPPGAGDVTLRRGRAERSRPRLAPGSARRPLFAPGSGWRAGASPSPPRPEVGGGRPGAGAGLQALRARAAGRRATPSSASAAGGPGSGAARGAASDRLGTAAAGPPPHQLPLAADYLECFEINLLWFYKSRKITAFQKVHRPLKLTESEQLR